jgi:hypothetical protein
MNMKLRAIALIALMSVFTYAGKWVAIYEDGVPGEILIFVTVG